MMTLTLTAAKLKELARSTSDEHDYLWSDGAYTWTLENLADEIEDEALEGMGGGQHEITLTAVKLSEAGEQNFVKGFCNAAPDWYVENGYPVDSDASNPWCAPWICGIDDWFKPGEMTAYEMGEAFYKTVADEMEALHAEDGEDFES